MIFRVLLLLSISCATALGYLGDSPSEMEAKYGKPMINEDGSPAFRLNLVYNYNGLMLRAGFINGFVEELKITKRGDADFTKDDFASVIHEHICKDGVWSGDEKFSTASEPFSGDAAHRDIAIIYWKNSRRLDGFTQAAYKAYRALIDTPSAK